MSTQSYSVHHAPTCCLLTLSVDLGLNPPHRLIVRVQVLIDRLLLSLYLRAMGLKALYPSLDLSPLGVVSGDGVDSVEVTLLQQSGYKQ